MNASAQKASKNLGFCPHSSRGKVSDSLVLYGVLVVEMLLMVLLQEERRGSKLTPKTKAGFCDIYYGRMKCQEFLVSNRSEKWYARAAWKIHPQSTMIKLFSPLQMKVVEYEISTVSNLH